MSRFHTIVVAVDFSDSTPDALEAALALAAAEAGSHVHLLHVVPSAVPPIWTDEPSTLDLRTVEQAWTDARAQAADGAGRRPAARSGEA